jgi:excisionase family DNA binding protein
MSGDHLLDVDRRWRGRLRLRGGKLENAWSEFLGRIPWQFFATLTFDPARRESVGAELASKEAFGWLCLVAYLCRRPIAWAYAVECSRNGFWHAHALIEGAGDPNLETLKSTWHMRNGQADLARVYDVPGVALYTAKGAAQGEVVVADTLTPARFNVSGGVVVPLVKGDPLSDGGAKPPQLGVPGGGNAAAARHHRVPPGGNSRHQGVTAGGKQVKSTAIPVLLTSGEVATSLRTTRKAIYAMVERGQLPGVIRLGRRVLFCQETLLDWLRQKSTPSLER